MQDCNSLTSNKEHTSKLAGSPKIHLPAGVATGLMDTVVPLPALMTNFVWNSNL